MNFRSSLLHVSFIGTDNQEVFWATCISLELFSSSNAAPFNSKDVSFSYALPGPFPFLLKNKQTNELTQLLWSLCHQIIALNTCPGSIIYGSGQFLHLLKILALAYSPSIFTTVSGLSTLPRKKSCSSSLVNSQLHVWRLFNTISFLLKSLLSYHSSLPASDLLFTSLQ